MSIGYAYLPDFLPTYGNSMQTFYAPASSSVPGATRRGAAHPPAVGPLVPGSLSHRRYHPLQSAQRLAPDGKTGIALEALHARQPALGRDRARVEQVDCVLGAKEKG